MAARVTPLEWAPVNDAETGRRIRERRTRLGMTVKALAERAGVDRGRLAKLEAGDLHVRSTTIGAVEGALDRLEHEMGMDIPSDDSGVVEFRVSGNFGVDVVVKGPVSNLEALEAAVSRLVSRMQAEQQDEGGT